MGRHQLSKGSVNGDNLPDFATLSTTHQPLEPGTGRRLDGLHQNHMLLPGQREELLCLSRCEDHRLLTQHMLPSAQGLPGVVVVRLMGGGDVDRIHPA